MAAHLENRLLIMSSVINCFDMQESKVILTSRKCLCNFLCLDMKLCPVIPCSSARDN